MTGTEEPKADAGGARERVAEWLAYPGVALELDVSRAFRTALANQTQPLVWSNIDVGRDYVADDPEHPGRQHLRETDVTVVMSRETRERMPVCLWLVIECKAATDPWICFRRTSLSEIPAQDLTETSWYVFSEPEETSARLLGGWHDSQFLRASDRICYAASSATGKENDRNRPNHARSALLQVLSAERGLRRDVGLENGAECISIVVPVVVTTAPLYAAIESGTGVEIVESRREVIEIRHDPRESGLRKVWVIAADEIDIFAREVVDLMGAFFYRRH